MDDEERREFVKNWLQRLNVEFPAPEPPGYNEQAALINLQLMVDEGIQYCEHVEDSQEYHTLIEQMNYYERDCPRDMESLNKARVAIGTTFITKLAGDHGVAKFRRLRMEQAVKEAAPTLSRLPMDETVRQAQINAVRGKGRFDTIFNRLDRAKYIARRTGVMLPLPAALQGLGLEGL